MQILSQCFGMKENNQQGTHRKLVEKEEGEEQTVLGSNWLKVGVKHALHFSTRYTPSPSLLSYGIQCLFLHSIPQNRAKYLPVTPYCNP